MVKGIALLFLLAHFAAAQQDGAAYFEKNVRPLLTAKCYACHSAASQPVMGGLRLDDRESILRGGSRGPAIQAGQPAGSLMLQAVRGEAGPLRMPPGGNLTDTEKAALAEWIAMGAPWGNAALRLPPSAAKFWAFVPPSKPAVPEALDPKWVQSPVDAFILREMRQRGLRPAPPADRRTLIRRVTFDLTGLPPTPAEVKAFLEDGTSNAFAKVVDRLLASPRYGERWGRHWLDVARYADSNGLDENLVYKNAFRYRDYVISAFNKDKPYDRFLTEQLAGDLLPETGRPEEAYERWTATGFLSLGAKMLAEDDPVKMEMDIIDEQMDTAMRAFTGLTVGCARCHDHKFDPISQKEYYALAGIFKSTKTMENFKVVARWHEHVLAPPADRERLAAHLARVEALNKEAGRITKTENELMTAAAKANAGIYLLAAAQAMRSRETVLTPAEGEGESAAIDARSTARTNVRMPLVRRQSNTPSGTTGPYYAEYELNLPAGEYQIDVLDEEKGAGTADLWINGVWARRGLPPVSNRAASPETGGWTALGVFPLHSGLNTIRLEHASRFPYFTKLSLTRYDKPNPPRTYVQIAAAMGLNASILEQLVEHMDRSQGAAGSELYGWEAVVRGGKLSAWSSTVAALFSSTDHAGEQAMSKRFGELFLRASREASAASDPGIRALHGLLTEKFGPFRAPGDARRYYAKSIQERLQELDAKSKKMEAEAPVFPQAMGVVEGKPQDLPLHVRGSHWTLGESVPRGFLRLGGGETPALHGSGRLQLAEWLTRPDHPLTARVMVNRMWRWRFGRGIVASVDNFGRLGEKPSHPELLDYLAAHFVEQGWSMKAMHRLMLLSSTYQMSSAYNEQSSEKDPENIYLWRFPRRRLEAEAMRDAIMAVAGDLDGQTGGSILKYRDRQYVSNTAKRGDVDYEKNIRAVYIPVVRSSMYDVFQAFDLPDPATSNGDRDATVVAPQALFMMNGTVMLRHSLSLARRLLERGDLDAAGRVREAYERALARPPTPAETDRGLTFIAGMEKAWQGDKQRAWQSFVKVLFSSKEFLYVD
jgi:hypothetical protein